MGEVNPTEVLTFPAAVIRPAVQDELRALALERQVIDEAYVEKYDPYFWPAEISSSRLDAHGTRMALSTLKNYAAEVGGDGVSFLYSHDSREIVGRSMGGRFVNAQGNGVARVTAEFFAVRGFQVGSVSSDQIIFGIDSKMLRDVSVGFYGGEWICSICGRDIWGYECRHWPLMKYEVEHDGQTESVICTADVEDAHLAEVSGVYKGSTPGAAIGKAEREAKDGRLTPEVRRMLETRFQLHLPDKTVRVPGHTQERDMPDPKEKEGIVPTSDSAELLTSVRTLVKGVGLSDDFADVPAGVRLLADEVARLRPLADDGTKYREAVVTEALTEGVRAFGNDFQREQEKTTLEALPIEHVRRTSAAWKAIADKQFQGGRQTVDSAEPADDPTAQTRTVDIPPAYHGAFSAS